MTWKRGIAETLVLVACATGIAGVTHAHTIYVDAAANGADDGSSWADACVHLQDALSAALAAGESVEIRVAQGVYKPDRGQGVTAGDREATFQLINEVAIKGGYAGVGGPDPDSRDIDEYETVLSGDLNGDDIAVSDPFDLDGEPTRSENSLHVVNGSGTDESAVLDGVTVTGGNAHIPSDPLGDDPRSYGGGILIAQGSPTLNRCRFQANSSDWLGGAMANMEHANPYVKDCRFVGNGGGSRFDQYMSTAGAVGNVDQSGPEFDSCTFTENAAVAGGAMYNHHSHPVMNNCTFHKNTAANYGGVVENEVSSVATFNNCIFEENRAAFAAGIENGQGSSIYLNNCIFANNVAERFAGAIRDILSADSTVTNCTFVNNTAVEGGGAFIGYLGSTTTLVNCILWNNVSPIAPQAGLREQCSISFTSCDVEGGQAGVFLDGSSSMDWEDNIELAPQFVDADHGNYRLQSQAGHWDPTQQSWVQDEVTSPCIDAGDPMSPIGLESFPNGGFVNIGAYGGTHEASRSHFGGPICETIIAGDINGDCQVDRTDLEIMALHWTDEEPLQP